QHRVRGGDQRADPVGERTRHGVLAPVDAQQRLPRGAHPHLLGGGPARAEVDELDALGLDQPPQRAPALVRRERGDQRDLGAGPRREDRGEPRTAGTLEGALLVAHRHRRVGAQARHGADDVAVEQQVADDDEPGHRDAPVSRTAGGTGWATAASSASHTRWIATWCTSCTVGVAASTETTSSTAAASGFGQGPTRARTTSPTRAAASTAASTLGERPEVDSTSSWSPARPWART